MVVLPSERIIYIMGGKERQQSQQQRREEPREGQAHSDGEQQSNQTMPIHGLDTLAIERISSGETALEPTNLYEFLKYKPIRKRGKRNETEGKDRLREQIRALTQRVAELQEKLRDARRQEDACPHCHFYLTQPKTTSAPEIPTPDGEPTCFLRSSSRESLEFEKMDFQAPLMYNQEMEEKSWIFLGTVLIAMGSKVMDTDGTVNVFKIVKESVDKIRRQVDKSAQRLSMDFFLAKEELGVEPGMNELDFDPFYQKEENPSGLQLESVRVESVEEYDLFFDQKLTFNIKYDALITAMEYMKENSSLTFT